MKPCDRTQITATYILVFLGWMAASFLPLFGQSREADDEFMLYNMDHEQVVPSASVEVQEKWKDDRFGMFIHWGPISQLGKQLSHSRNSRSHRPGGKPYKVAAIEPEVYDIQYKTFNPVQFDPDAIVSLAKRAGMKYLVFTAKHHAGFSMFDSKVSEYDIMMAPYGKDILKELEQACRRQDFGFGFYYSPRDWRHPDCDSEHNHPRYIKFYRAQMEELLNHYGQINSIFFDGMGPGEWGNTATEVMQRIRTLQPQAMVNDRGGAGADYYTPEHTVSHFNRKQLWEACHTTTGQWGYNPDTGAKSLAQLMEILLYTWGADGNLLLNIGPRGDGSLNPEEVERLEQIADWWQIHGQASIRGSRGGPYFPGPWGVSTCKGKSVFLHVFRWPSDGKFLEIPKLPGREIVESKVLSGGVLNLKELDDGLSIYVPPQDRREIVTTIELKLDGDATSIEPLPAQQSLTWGAKLTASQNSAAIYATTDQDATTWWDAHTDNKDPKPIWIEVDFGSPVNIGSVVTGRGEEWYPRNEPELQIPDGKGGWKTAFAWKPKWEPVKFLDQPVTTDRIRLWVRTSRYHLAEFELYPPM